MMVRDGRAIAVDLNGRRPGLGRMLGGVNAPGLADLIAGTAGFADAIHRDRGSRAHVLPVGREASAIATSPQLTTVMDALSQTYDYLVIDCGAGGPPRQELLRGADIIAVITIVRARPRPMPLRRRSGVPVPAMCGSSRLALRRHRQ